VLFEGKKGKVPTNYLVLRKDAAVAKEEATLEVPKEPTKVEPEVDYKAKYEEQVQVMADLELKLQNALNQVSLYEAAYGKLQ
jgi:hypothetical protein